MIVVSRPEILAPLFDMTKHIDETNGIVVAHVLQVVLEFAGAVLPIPAVVWVHLRAPIIGVRAACPGGLLPLRFRRKAQTVASMSEP